MKKIKTLSARNLSDCSTQNKGCGGGNLADAFRDIQQGFGLETEDDYPYLGQAVAMCRLDEANSVFTDTNAYEFSNFGEEFLMSLVARFGPISVAATIDNWQGYKSSVFDDD